MSQPQVSVIIPHPSTAHSRIARRAKFRQSLSQLEVIVVLDGGVCTYRRPKGTSSPAVSIAQLRFDSIPAPDIEIIVVENTRTNTRVGPLRYALKVKSRHIPGIVDTIGRPSGSAPWGRPHVATACSGITTVR